MFEKVYNSAEQKAEAGGKGKIFRTAADVAVAHSKALDAGKVPLGLKLQFALFDRLVLLQAPRGDGRQRASTPSRAPRRSARASATSTAASASRSSRATASPRPRRPRRSTSPTKFKIGTVGPALPGVGVRIADDGEIQVKGINVFDGYWKNAEATAEAFDGEWFKTGDIGSLDDDGYLTITGRKKEIIVTAGGKNVAPAALEDPIRANPLVGQVVVVGDQKPFISALITLDPEMLPVWLNNNGEDADMTARPRRRRTRRCSPRCSGPIDAANANVSRAESIRKFTSSRPSSPRRAAT